MAQRIEVQSMYLGSTGNVQSFNETESSFPYPDLIGQMVRRNDGWFQLVRFATTQSGSPTAGKTAFWWDPDTYTVTNAPDLALAITGASGIGQNINTVAGMIVGAPTAGNLGFVQKGGKSICAAYACSLGVAGQGVCAVSTGFATLTSGLNTVISSPVNYVLHPVVGFWRTSTAANTSVARVDLLLRAFEM